ncbi:MAG: hypothetical protein M0Z50_13005 [Planctomycetia bacterium]|nr:hypothetical protein [Planctomycetia bacterium]
MGVPYPLMKNTRQHIRVASLSSALWLIGVGLTANALVMLWTHRNFGAVNSGNLVMAAPAISMDAGHAVGGITVVPTRLTASRWGFLFVDTRNDVVAVYRLVGTQSRIQFMASRDFRSDLRLKDFNTLPPTPAQVKAMVVAAKALAKP